jgi:hypothetical protein
VCQLFNFGRGNLNFTEVVEVKSCCFDDVKIGITGRNASRHKHLEKACANFDVGETCNLVGNMLKNLA